MLLESRVMKYTVAVGSLLGSTFATLTVFSQGKAIAAPLNPCPKIYYEEPFNSNYLVPQGCPQNAATQKFRSSEAPTVFPNRVTPSGQSTPQQPPLPESRQNAIAVVPLNNGLFDVEITNNTNVLVSYQVVGYTDRRYLQGRESATLRGIPTPATVIFTRQDNGFVEVTPVSATEAGMFGISLSENTSPTEGRTSALRVQADGKVFLN